MAKWESAPLLEEPKWMEAPLVEQGLPPDPAEEEKQIKDTVDISYDLGISVADANANYKQIADKPEKRPPSKAGFSFVAVTPSKWEKFKEFFTSKRDPLPPNADRIEKVARAFDIVMGAPLRAFMKLSKGMTLGAPDLMWAAIKRITPEDMWVDEVKDMTLDEAMDWAGGYDPSGFQKVVGEIAEFGGRIKTVAPIAQKIGIIGNTPKDITVLDKAFESAKLFGAAAVGEQVQKFASSKIDPTEAEYGYEGPKAVLRDMAIGAAFNLLHSGVKGAWSKLTPTEHQRALKLLGLKKDATTNEIKAAARDMFRKYHPDKAKGFQTEFENVIKARDTLLKGEPQDIVFRGQKVVFKPKLLEGETLQQQAIRLAQKPAEVVKKPAPKPPVKKPEVSADAKRIGEETPLQKKLSKMMMSGIEQGNVGESARGIFGDLTEAGITPQQAHKQFWSEIFPQMTPEAQQMAREELSKAVGETVTPENQQEFVDFMERELSDTTFDTVERADRKLLFVEAGANEELTRFVKQPKLAEAKQPWEISRDAKKRGELTHGKLGDEVKQFKGTGGISSENKLTAGFRHKKTGEIFEAKDETGRNTSIHLLGGIPAKYVTEVDPRDGVTIAVSGDIEAGFIKDGKFLTREEAAQLTRPDAALAKAGEAGEGGVESEQGLIEEAKKYKTLDEFVANVPIKSRSEKRQAIKEWKKKTGYKSVDSSFDRGDNIHSPSDPESGSPLYDLTENGIYPEDVYSMNGRRYYGTGEDKMDSKAYDIISYAEGNPNAIIKIYRAVEKGDPQKILPGD